MGFSSRLQRFVQARGGAPIVADELHGGTLAAEPDHEGVPADADSSREPKSGNQASLLEDLPRAHGEGARQARREA